MEFYKLTRKNLIKIGSKVVADEFLNLHLTHYQPKMVLKHFKI